MSGITDPQEMKVGFKMISKILKNEVSKVPKYSINRLNTVLKILNWHPEYNGPFSLFYEKVTCKVYAKPAVQRITLKAIINSILD